MEKDNNNKKLQVHFLVNVFHHTLVHSIKGEVTPRETCKLLPDCISQ